MLNNYKNELNKMSVINIPSELFFLDIIHFQCNENINLFGWVQLITKKHGHIKKKYINLLWKIELKTQFYF